MKKFYFIQITLIYLSLSAYAQFSTTIEGPDSLCIGNDSIYYVNVSPFDNHYFFKDTTTIGTLTLGYSGDTIINTFSYDLWVKPTRGIIMKSESNLCPGSVSVPLAHSNQNWAILPSHGGTAALGVGLTIGTNGLMVAEHCGNLLISRLSYTTAINDWIHIAIVYRPDSIFLYLDGNLVNSRNTPCISNAKWTSEYLSFNYFSPEFKGNIDEFRLWDIALTCEQVQYIKNKRFLNNVEGLRYYASFDNGKFERTLGDIGSLEMTLSGEIDSNNIKLSDWDIGNYTGQSIDSLSPFNEDSFEFLWSTGSTEQTTLFTATNSLNILCVDVFNSSISKSDSTIVVGVDCGVQIPDYIPTEGLVAWYPFNGNANDESGNGLHGTVNGAVLTTDRFGNINSAYFFTTDKDIVVPNTENQNLYPITISLWYNVDTIADDENGNLFSKYVPAAWNGYQLLVDDNRNVQNNGEIYNNGFANSPWYIRSTSDRVLGYYGEPPFLQENITFHTWYHFVFVVDSTGGQIYVDGQLIDTHNWTGEPGPCTNSFLWKIGGLYSNWYHGKIDDICIYNRALSNNEILELYNEAPTGFLCADVNMDGLVNVLDIIATVNYIMGGNPNPFNMDAADVNADGAINVLDIIAIVNIIMQVPGIPCPCIPIVNYEGQTYNTVQIGQQCWLKENLNVGTKINSTTGGFLQANNGIIEKYCYNNDEANCAIYGGLYEWPEAMQYVETEGTQGICPNGWHIPTDNEWKIMEGTVDSQYPVGDPEWDDTGWRGLDAGGNLKESGTSHWTSPNTGATNSSGFTGLPAGYRNLYTGGFDYPFDIGNFWSSSQYDTGGAWYRNLNYNDAYVYRTIFTKEFGFSIRCLMDTP